MTSSEQSLPSRSSDAGPSRIGVLVRSVKLVRDAAGGSLAFVAVVQIVAGLLGGAVLFAAGRVIEGLSGDEADWSATWPWIVALAAITTVMGVLTAVGQEQQHLISELVSRHTTTRLIKASSHVPFAWFDDEAFYNRMTRASAGSSGSATSIVWGTLGATRSLINAGVIVILLLAIVPLVIPIALVAFVPLFLMSRRSNRVQHRFAWDQTEDDRHRGYISSVFSGRTNAREVRMFDLGNWFGTTHDRLWQERLVRLRKVIRISIANSAIGALVSSSLTALALGLVAWMASRGDISLADAGIGILGAHRLGGAATQLNNQTASLHQGGLRMLDYDNFMAEAEQAAQADVGNDVPEVVDTITLENVSFRYPGAPAEALRNVDLTVSSGHVTALVGTNGSGKSTLMLLLCGLYAPTSGRVLWDGVDIATFKPSALRAAVAPMFQDFVRYQLTARENVVVSDQAAAADEERTQGAIETASARPVIDRLAHGLDTRLSRAYADGTELSAGQWQRLAVARALFHGGPLLILDEPSADLDPLAERELVDELSARSDNRAVLVISHRFSAVRRAERIIVLNDGQLVEEGSHAELLAKSGIYAAMYQTQVGG